MVANELRKNIRKYQEKGSLNVRAGGGRNPVSEGIIGDVARMMEEDKRTEEGIETQ